MLSEIATLFDPEIVIPSTTNVSNGDFWLRLVDWIEDPRPRMNPETYLAFNDFTSRLMDGSLRKTEVLPLGDLHAIVGRLTSRVRSLEESSRTICVMHATKSYVPFFGAASNTELLLREMCRLGAYDDVVIASDARCWPEPPSADCVACCDQRIHVTVEPNRPPVSVWRDRYGRSGCSLADLEKTAASAFPNIVFSDVAWKSINSLQGARQDNVVSLSQHLGVLNDEAPSIWSSNPNTSDRQQQLASRGVTASPESSRTHKTSKAMLKRKFKFDGQTVMCEWHTKLRPDTNRIYFAVDGSQVLVGSIVDHLPT